MPRQRQRTASLAQPQRPGSGARETQRLKQRKTRHRAESGRTARGRRRRVRRDVRLRRRRGERRPEKGDKEDGRERGREKERERKSEGQKMQSLPLCVPFFAVPVFSLLVPARIAAWTHLPSHGAGFRCTAAPAVGDGRRRERERKRRTTLRPRERRATERWALSGALFPRALR